MWKIPLRTQCENKKYKIFCCYLLCFLLLDKESHIIHHALLFDLAAGKLGTTYCVQVWLISCTASLLAHFRLYQSESWPSWHLNKVIVKSLMRVWGTLGKINKLWWNILGLVASGKKPVQTETGGKMRSGSCWHMDGGGSCRRRERPDTCCSCWWKTTTTANPRPSWEGAWGNYLNIFLFLTFSQGWMAIGQHRQQPDGEETQPIDSMEVSIPGHRAGWRVDLEGQVKTVQHPVSTRQWTWHFTWVLLQWCLLLFATFVIFF